MDWSSSIPKHILVREFGIPAFICFMIPGLKRMSSDHWSKTMAMSMIRAEDPGLIKLRKSAWKKTQYLHTDQCIPL